MPAAEVHCAVECSFQTERAVRGEQCVRRNRLQRVIFVIVSRRNDVGTNV